MKRVALILFLGVFVSTAAFSGFYYLGTARARALMSQPQPELAWLKREFHLSDAELVRITTLHEAYLPHCAERCQRIAEQNERLGQLLAQTSVLTPEIQNLLTERAKTRADCEAEMLKHFLEVSRTMPAEQGRRYLEWVEQQTCLNGQGMEANHQPQSVNPMPVHHHH